jgi:hypothetical protein
MGVNKFIIKNSPFLRDIYNIKTNFLNLTSTGYNRHEEKCTYKTNRDAHF